MDISLSILPYSFYTQSNRIISNTQQGGYHIDQRKIHRKRHNYANPSRPPNNAISLSSQTTISPFNTIPLPNLPHNPRGLPTNNTPTRHHHTRRHNRTIKHISIVLDNSHTTNNSTLPNMNMIPQLRSLDNSTLTYKDMVADLERVKRVCATV